MLVIGAILQIGGLISAVAHLEAQGESEQARPRARAAMAGIIACACVAFPLEVFLLYR